MLHDPDDPQVLQALTIECPLCKAKPGIRCVCITCAFPCELESCPTGTGRIVHQARVQPPKRGAR
ncbi:hypothetical protein SEA_GODPHATHER_54 [Mycobacterium phage GodPhather]|uniref:Uncharacterized protein n=1 Tax=Mycobacterium phage Jeon TaxID=2108123 RepID=A0A2P1JRI0_9CAUD|nr:hypothetical protein PQB70_gp53 [Mycobacterium phage Jeon]AVO21756.1 hypothetical protein SEA_JEON_53 [Mycobacterium phage Jeon]QBP32627.1 hypothetical protein SEA_GODPHATHER_54 [Mycobacterium phage GodPhather]